MENIMEKITKKQEILTLWKGGATMKEITKKLDTYYAYVHDVIKEYKLLEQLKVK